MTDQTDQTPKAAPSLGRKPVLRTAGGLSPEEARQQAERAIHGIKHPASLTRQQGGTYAQAVGAALLAQALHTPALPEKAGDPNQQTADPIQPNGRITLHVAPEHLAVLQAARGALAGEPAEVGYANGQIVAALDDLLGSAAPPPAPVQVTAEGIVVEPARVSDADFIDAAMNQLGGAAAGEGAESEGELELKFTPSPKLEAALKEPETETEVPGNPPGAELPPVPDPEPVEHRCPHCNADPFGSARGVAAHIRAKHPEHAPKGD